MSQTQLTTESEPEEQEQSSTIQCASCDNIMPASAVFCGVCGSPMLEGTPKKSGRQTPREQAARQFWAWPVIIVLSAIAAALAAVFMPGTLPCLLLDMWFLFICPGMMIVRFLRLNAPAAEWMLALAFSFAFDGLVAGVLIYSGVWTPARTLSIVIAFSVVGSVAQLLWNYRPAVALRPARRPLAAALPLASAFLLIGAIAAASTWSPVYTALSAKPAHTTVSRPRAAVVPRVTPPPPAQAVDAVIIVDNVDLIGAYDPRGDRFAAAQLFVSLVPPGSHIGVIRVTSSLTPATALPFQTIQNNSDRQSIENRLTAKAFGAVDTAPTAYFTPALQAAAAMLHQAPAKDRKYILLVTDALAYSGDQNACPSSPDIYHRWFCEAGLLGKQGIPVIVISFTRGTTAPLAIITSYMKAHGGAVVAMTDSSALGPYLTPIYNNLLKGVRPTL